MRPSGVTAVASTIPHTAGRIVPQELDAAGLERIREGFVAAAKRADWAGFEVAEVHCAHGYLMNEFLSPIANKRTDNYGGSLENRMRFPLEVIEAVRAVWPQHKPLFVRISAVDGVEGGTTLDDSVMFAHEAAKRGADIIDVSGGGVATTFNVTAGPGYLAPFAHAIKTRAQVKTMAVGLITEPQQAAQIIDHGQADLVAIGREALFNPHWPLHAEKQLTGDALDFAAWPVQEGHWLARRAQALVKLKG